MSFPCWLFLSLFFFLLSLKRSDSYSVRVVNKKSIYFLNSPVKKTVVRPSHTLLLAKVAKDNFEIVKRKLETIGIGEETLKESFIKGSGNGGQKINKTSNCVMLKCDPHNIVIRCQKYRCLQKNRIHAREILYNKVASIKDKEKKEIVSQLEKEKRRILKLTEREKNESINYKRRKSQIKKNRQKILDYDV